MATLSPWQKLHTKVSQESEQCTRKKPVTVISSRGLRVERGTRKVASIKVTRSIIEHGNRPTTTYLISWSIGRPGWFRTARSFPSRRQWWVTIRILLNDPRFVIEETRLWQMFSCSGVVQRFVRSYDCYRDYDMLTVMISKFPYFRYRLLINCILI